MTPMWLSSGSSTQASTIDRVVVHEVAPDLVARIGEAVRLAAVGGEEEQPRRSDAVAAEDHEVGLLPLPHAGHPVDVDGAGRASVPRLDLLDPGIRDEPGARGNRLRPQRQGHVVERPGRAAALACAAIVAAGPSVERLAEDALRHGPAVPAEPVEGLARADSERAMRRRRCRERSARRDRRVALVTRRPRSGRRRHRTRARDPRR